MTVRGSRASSSVTGKATVGVFFTVFLPVWTTWELILTPLTHVALPSITEIVGSWLSAHLQAGMATKDGRFSSFLPSFLSFFLLFFFFYCSTPTQPLVHQSELEAWEGFDELHIQIRKIICLWEKPVKIITGPVRKIYDYILWEVEYNIRSYDHYIILNGLDSGPPFIWGLLCFYWSPEWT